MQLSLSSPPIDPISLPKFSLGETSAPADNYSANSASTDESESSDFQDLLNDGEKSKSPRRPGFGRDESPSTARASQDPTLMTDLAAMFGFVTNPIAPETPPIALPDLDFTPAGPVGENAAASLIASGELSAAGNSVLPPASPGIATAAASTAMVDAATYGNTAETASQAVPLPVPGQPLNATRADRQKLSQAAALSTGANIAESLGELPAPEKAPIGSGFENFLSEAKEGVTNDEESLGIDVAKPVTTMAAIPFSHRQSELGVESVALSAPNAHSAVTARELTAQASEIATVSHHAVAAVLTAAERATGERTSVNLQFLLDGSELAVRVEFRGGAVHTTFRSDSPEVRAALSQEWAAAGSRISDASLRIAAPVFSASNGGDLPGFSGESASQQRESAARHTAEQFAFRGTSSTRTSSHEDSAPLAPQRAALITTQYLHTFA